MQRREQAGWHQDFTETAREFERWRAKRRPGTRIPESLWNAATALAGKHGVARAAATLNLDYYSVKKRLEGRSEAVAASAARASSRARFVELPIAGGASTVTCTLEVEREVDGRSKLRLELGGIVLSDLEAVIRAAQGRDA